MLSNRDFDEWLATFRGDICDFKYWINFDKVYKKVAAYKVELNILNSLIGAEDIEKEFVELARRYPEIIKVIPCLLAIRGAEINCLTPTKTYNYNFNSQDFILDDYVLFMHETGLFELIQNHIINNLVDYALGVETGLDSNARKNRGGHLMEDLVESFLVKAGFVKNESYFKEMKASKVQHLWGLDMSEVLNKGKAEKRFDFVVKTSGMVYGVEVNAYRSGGSKLNETARSYKTIAIEAERIPGFTYVWFTDGGGWFKARNNLRETWDVMEHLYNIADLENGIVEQVFV